VPGDAAQAQDTVRIRGTIASIDGATYVIKARDGAELKVALGACLRNRGLAGAFGANRILLGHEQALSPLEDR
jgi:hypothetical protein